MLPSNFLFAHKLSISLPVKSDMRGADIRGEDSKFIAWCCSLIYIKKSSWTIDSSFCRDYNIYACIITIIKVKNNTELYVGGCLEAEIKREFQSILHIFIMKDNMLVILIFFLRFGTYYKGLVYVCTG